MLFRSADKAARAWRLDTRDTLIEYEDCIQGPQRQNVARDVGDFVLLRADRVYAYQLAVVVDDADQGITEVVRGADLLDSTPRQIYLQRLLGAPTPRYCHVPVAVNERGEKLSKQTLASSINTEDEKSSLAELRKAAKHLGLYGLPDGDTTIAEWLLSAIHAWKNTVL